MTTQKKYFIQYSVIEVDLKNVHVVIFAIESCVPPSDHSVPIVHETLQLLRDKVSVGPIEFHDYLLKNNIQVIYIYCWILLFHIFLYL